MQRAKCHHSVHFQNAYNKYGESSFVYDIIENVQDSSQLLIREQYYLDTLLFAQDYINKITNHFQKEININKKINEVELKISNIKNENYFDELNNNVNKNDIKKQSNELNDLQITITSLYNKRIS